MIGRSWYLLSFAVLFVCVHTWLKSKLVEKQDRNSAKQFQESDLKVLEVPRLKSSTRGPAAIPKLATGEQINLPSGQFEILKVKAIEHGDYKENLGPVLDEKFGYVLVEESEATDRISGRLVVAKKGSDALAVITGVLFVGLQDMSLAKVIEATFSLKLLFIDESLKTAIFSIADSREAPNTIAALRKHQGVESANLEILQSERKL